MKRSEQSDFGKGRRKARKTMKENGGVTESTIFPKVSGTLGADVWYGNLKNLRLKHQFSERVWVCEKGYFRSGLIWEDY